MKQRTRISCMVLTGVLAALGGVTLAWADLSGSVDLRQGNISFEGMYQYDVYWDENSQGVLVAGKLKSAKDDSGYLNGKQQAYDWARLAYVDIGKSTNVSVVLGPGDTRWARDLRLSVCTDHWFWDDCTEELYPR